MSDTSTMFRFVALAAVLVMIGIACSNSSDPVSDDPGQTVSSTNCIGCHTDDARLQATATPDTSSGGGEGSGEG